MVGFGPCALIPHQTQGTPHEKAGDSWIPGFRRVRSASGELRRRASAGGEVLQNALGATSSLLMAGQAAQEGSGVFWPGGKGGSGSLPSGM